MELTALSDTIIWQKYKQKTAVNEQRCDDILKR